MQAVWFVHKDFFYTSWQQLNVIAREAGIYNDTVPILKARDDSNYVI